MGAPFLPLRRLVPLLEKQLHFRCRIVRLMVSLAIYHKEVFSDEKHMATTGGKKPSEYGC